MNREPRSRDLLAEGVRICTKCIFDETLSNITFDADGVCSFCKMIEDLKTQYGTGEDKGRLLFENIVAQIKRAGRGKQ